MSKTVEKVDSWSKKSKKSIFGQKSRKSRCLVKNVDFWSMCHTMWPKVDFRLIICRFLVKNVKEVDIWSKMSTPVEKVDFWSRMSKESIFDQKCRKMLKNSTFCQKCWKSRSLVKDVETVNIWSIMYESRFFGKKC